MSVAPEQLHSLLTYCLDFARTMLSDSGEFYPFGAVMEPNGTLKAVGAHDGHEHPAPSELYTLLSSTFARQASDGEIIGAALAANVNVPEGYDSPFADAVRVKLEGSEYSRFVYWPYKIERKGLFKKRREVQLAEPFAVELEPDFFKPS